MPHQPRPPRYGCVVVGFLCALLGWAVATWLRHGLVEPALLTVRCDAWVWSPLAWADWAMLDMTCGLRTLTVQAFLHHRLAHVALVLAVLGGLLRARWMTGAALCLGAAALVLYSADRGALAVLLAGWGWVAAWAPAPPAQPRN